MMYMYMHDGVLHACHATCYRPGPQQAHHTVRQPLHRLLPAPCPAAGPSTSRGSWAQRRYAQLRVATAFASCDAASAACSGSAQ